MKKINKGNYTTRRLIEEWTMDVLKNFACFNGSPITPPVPIYDIAEKLLLLKIDIQTFAKKRAALIVPSKRWILLNDQRNRRRIRFSAAHEIAHWLIEGFDDYDSTIGKANISILRRSQAHERERLVNYFAGSLLMPFPLLLQLQNVFSQDLEQLVDELSEMFDVTQSTVRTRLSDFKEIAPFINLTNEEIVSYYKLLHAQPIPFELQSSSKYALIIPPISYLDHRFTRLVETAKKEGKQVYIVLNRDNIQDTIPLCEFDLVDGFVWANMQKDTVLSAFQKLPDVEWHDLSHTDNYIRKLEHGWQINSSAPFPFVAFTRADEEQIVNKQLALHSLSDQIESRVKLNTRNDARQFIAQHQKLGKTIAVVTGCFDLLTNAHVQFFHKAKAQGDVLVVGIENDLRIRAFKGKYRPVNTASQRIEVLNELRCIDFTFVINGSPHFEIKPFYTRLHKTLRADILVVTDGDPYMSDRREEIEAAGGKLVVVSKSEEVYSSSVLRKFLEETELADIVFVSKKTLYQLKQKEDSSWKQVQLPISLLDS
jgi:D-glycero-beta-D-manno-heptose 1-phosphate adenylyltransferase